MNGLIAVRRLKAMGYRFQVDGEALCYEWQGTGKPDPSQVRPLLALVKEHKPEVLAYLSQKQKNHALEKCSCGLPAWDTDAEGKSKCWCCLAIPGLFGAH